MKAKSIHNLPMTDELTEENGVLIARNGGISRMLLRKFRTYIAYATGADVLGVPVPTKECAGMSPVVNKNGEYTLKRVNRTNLLWENPDPSADFPAQTITCNTNGYKILVVILKHTDHTVPETVSFANDGTEARLSVFKIGVKSQTSGGATTNVATVVEEWRRASTNNTGVTFGNGVRTEYQGASREGTDYAIPIAIYGIA